MSLFKTREWWSTSVGEEEEFDNGCLCVGNVDNDPSEKGKVAKINNYFIYLFIHLFIYLFIYLLLF